MRKLIRFVLIALGLLGGAGFAAGQSVTLHSVETDVVVRTDGKADFFESMDWEVSAGQMHGFYFQGAAGGGSGAAGGGSGAAGGGSGATATPVFNLPQCFADLAGNERVGLSITDLGAGKYDVVLAGGRAFSGKAMYFLNYACDLARSGLIGGTKSDQFGELFYFDWAAEQWDYSMEHRTIRIELPIVVSGESVASDTLTKLGFRTEPYVNQENSIDAFGTKGTDGKYYFTLRFHQENLAAYQTQRLQFYLDRAAIPMTAGVLSERTAAAQTSSGTSSAPAGGATSPATSPSPSAGPGPQAGLIATSAALFALLVLAILLYILKARGYGRTLEKVKGISWAGDNWVPPRLFAGTYTVKGKIAEGLHPVEVALLLEQPLPKVVAIML